jgi:succinate dehydrogenase flavin-adding protein (antitoxin of CptAB toxin-antitoxin module)
MSNLNFQEMSREELKKYIRINPTDDEAIRELFVNRRNPNAKRYPYPYDMPSEEVEAIFKEKLDRVD